MGNPADNDEGFLLDPQMHIPGLEPLGFEHTCCLPLLKALAESGANKPLT